MKSAKPDFTKMFSDSKEEIDSSRMIWGAANKHVENNPFDVNIARWENRGYDFIAGYQYAVEHYEKLVHTTTDQIIRTQEERNCWKEKYEHLMLSSSRHRGNDKGEGEGEGEGE